MEKTIQSTLIFQGRIVRLEVLEVELDDGTRSRREIVRHPGAVVVLAELPDGRFVMVRQFRKALERDFLEAVAGTLEPGEDPADCARRELKEETGYAAQSLVSLGVIVNAPGYSTEQLHVFYATVGAEADAADMDEDERITVVLMPGTDIDDMIRQGELLDSKTLSTWMLYKSRIIQATVRAS